MRAILGCLLLLVLSSCVMEGIDEVDVDDVAQASRISLDDATTIAGGDRHTCALRYDGTVRCAGYNGYGQLGNGTVVSSLTPVTVTGLANVTAVTAGHDHTCALGADGRVLCWGRNDFGQLGNGSTVKSTTPVAVIIGVSDFVSISAGDYHTCAVRSGGTVRCWGRGTYGQLGQGFAGATTPVLASGISSAVSVAAGGSHTCATTALGTVACWGRNNRGQLGDGTTTDRHTAVAIGSLSGVEAVTAGASHTCALLSASTMSCWGDNTFGQLATLPGGSSAVPVGIPTALGTGISAVDAGENHTCALDAGGTVICWGWNGNAQLGRGGIAAPVPPDHQLARIPNLTGVVGINLGLRHSCAQLASGVLRCWGANASGQLGDNTTTQRSTPWANGFFAGLRTDVAGGYKHTCGLRFDGRVKCWGGNTVGELGDGTTIDHAFPGFVGGLDRVEAIDALYEHTCAVRAEGTVWCWGWNNAGQLGDLTTTDRSLPVQVAEVSSTVDVAAGRWHSCALLADGTVRCWGDNTYGQLGDGTYTSSPKAVTVSGLADAVAIDAGSAHTCALRQTGEVSCWGENLLAQLGTGNFVWSPVPVRAQLPTAAIEIGAGNNHTCAVLVNNSVYCWGANDFGQSHPGSAALLEPTPTQIAGFEGAEEVAAGSGHSCAQLANGLVWCWGDNRFGQIGDGGPLNLPAFLLPTKVTSLDYSNHLELGMNHSFAVAGDGTLRGWGDNFFGQLGNGTTTSSSTPLVIAFP